MGQVQFYTHNGIEKTDLKPNQSVLKAAYNINLDAYGYGECGGNCACATCHVYVLEGLEQFKEPTTAELEMLDQLPDAQTNSRLGCQLSVPAAAKIVVKLPNIENTDA